MKLTNVTVKSSVQELEESLLGSMIIYITLTKRKKKEKETKTLQYEGK